MNDTFVKKLIDFGLSEKEAKVYLATLELEVASANDIAKATGINRSTTYVVIESLQKRGFVGVSDENETHRYIASSPDTLLQSAEREVTKQKSIKKDIDEVLPELKSIYKESSPRPKIRVFDDEQGLKEILYDPLNKKASEFRTYSDPAELIKMVPSFFDFNEDRESDKVMMYSINPATKENADLYKNVQPGPNSKIAIISPEIYKAKSNIAVYGSNIALLSPSEGFGLIIESKEIAEMFRINFDLAFKEAQNIDVRKGGERKSSQKTKRI